MKMEELFEILKTVEKIESTLDLQRGIDEDYYESWLSCSELKDKLRDLFNIRAGEKLYKELKKKI